MSAGRATTLEKKKRKDKPEKPEVNVSEGAIEPQTKRQSKKAQEDGQSEAENVEIVKGDKAKQRLKEPDGESTVRQKAVRIECHPGKAARPKKKLADPEHPVDEELGGKDNLNKKSAKRKRDHGRHDGEKKKGDRKEDTSVDEGYQEPSKKKRRNDTGFLDPNEDASLSNQARKALAYAFVRFYQPSSWKFNKARQNWLVRNYWIKETIPEVYVSLVVSYLANVQGGVRENLITQCRAALEVPDANTAAQADPASEVPASGGKTDPMEEKKIKQIRGRTLLDALVPSEEI